MLGARTPGTPELTANIALYSSLEKITTLLEEADCGSYSAVGLIILKNNEPNFASLLGRHRLYHILILYTLFLVFTKLFNG